MLQADRRIWRPLSSRLKSDRGTLKRPVMNELSFKGSHWLQCEDRFAITVRGTKKKTEIQNYMKKNPTER